MDDAGAVPFGQFMEMIPHWGFIIIHSVLIAVGVWLSRRSRAAGSTLAARGFLLFVLAELSYISYHAHLTHFLLAHIVAEVCDALAFLTIGLSLTKTAAPPPR
jgi:hypothetical protein